MKETRVPESACPVCGEKHDGCASLADMTPKPGDFSLCPRCQSIVVFNEDLTVRLPTEQDLLELPTLEISRMQRFLKQYKAVYSDDL